MVAKADVWQKKIDSHQEYRKETISLQQDIQEAMISYLKTVGETEDFSLNYHEFGEIELHCEGDLFDLEQISGFCDVFGVHLLLNNRLVVEDYMTAKTTVKTGYLFTITDFKKEKKDTGDE